MQGKSCRNYKTQKGDGHVSVGSGHTSQPTVQTAGLGWKQCISNKQSSSAEKISSYLGWNFKVKLATKVVFGNQNSLWSSLCGFIIKFFRNTSITQDVFSGVQIFSNNQMKKRSYKHQMTHLLKHGFCSLPILIKFGSKVSDFIWVFHSPKSDGLSPVSHIQDFSLSEFGYEQISSVAASWLMPSEYWKWYLVLVSMTFPS